MSSDESRKKPVLLIVDDDEDLCVQMKWGLSQDYQVLLAADRVQAMELLQQKRPPVITLDLGLPPDPDGVDEGFISLREMLDQDNLSKIIVITGRDEKQHAMEAIGEGAYDFMAKPVQLDDLKVILRRAFHISYLERERQSIIEQNTGDIFEGMIGTSPQMEEVYNMIRKVSTTDMPVLICGESGTGKELVANAIHQRSTRRNGPFVTINCGAIPEPLLESELFGHEKGAFTGAHVQRRGRIELAQNGTLFFDEIGELPLSMQIKLLRFLQDQLVERIGGREMIPVDTRIISATNKDLEKSIQEQSFREDLYYRLGVLVLQMPALRVREGDIVLLAKALLDRFARESGKKVKGFTKSAIRAMENFSWPGNIREMENRIKRALVMTESSRITPAELELERSTSNYQGKNLKEAKEMLEKEIILNSLKKHNKNVSKTAIELGITRPTLYNIMKRLKIQEEE